MGVKQTTMNNVWMDVAAAGRMQLAVARMFMLFTHLSIIHLILLLPKHVVLIHVTICFILVFPRNPLYLSAPNKA